MQASVQPSSNLASTVQSSAGTNATIAEPSLHPEPTGLFLFLPAGIALGRVRSVALGSAFHSPMKPRLNQERARPAPFLK